ncbi:hypothetical protein KBY93_14315 [Synechococcus sp. J7-Johnson]|uniref:hypothetical protein n=1 Tax=Synechococcus sp. J7-Johnson TaxID=2823737 RepID=UPI0020CB8A5A|nr:hypothetical protein [Synechococcus sp. J7-Johnson]MCP9841797.1 hypothetical protein [Synechococcus sp. J7-Johnson]
MIKTLVSYPDYTMGNAYQELVYKSYAGKVVYGDIDKAIEISEGDQSCIFHIHWLNQIIKNDRQESEKLAEEFKQKVLHLQLRGSRLAWTVHNLLGHHTNTKDTDFEIGFRRWLADKVDLLILHKPGHLNLIRSVYKCSPKHCYFHEHGLYELKPKTIPKALIQETAIKPGSFIISLLGQIRKYKGLAEAIEIFNAISEKTNKDLVLLVAGAVEWSYRNDVATLLDTVYDQNRLVSVQRRLLDEELHWLTEHSSLIMLPYTKILNSGSLRYNQTLGTISAIPSRHMELFRNEPGILFYTDIQDAANQIKVLIDETEEANQQRSFDIKRQAQTKLSWPDLTAIMNQL